MQDAPAAVLYPPIDDDDDEDSEEFEEGSNDTETLLSTSPDVPGATTRNRTLFLFPQPSSPGVLTAAAVTGKKEHQSKETRRRKKGVTMSRELASHFDALKKRKADGGAITQHHRAVAARAARLAAEEVGRLRRAVAELEGRLILSEGDTGGPDPAPPPPPEVVVVVAHHRQRHEIPTDRGSSDDSDDSGVEEDGVVEGDPEEEAVDNVKDSNDDDDLERKNHLPVVS